MHHIADLMIQQLITQLPTEILGAAIVTAAAAAWRSWRRNRGSRKSRQKQWTNDATQHSLRTPDCRWIAASRPECRCKDRNDCLETEDQIRGRS